MELVAATATSRATITEINNIIFVLPGLIVVRLVDYLVELMVELMVDYLVARKVDCWVNCRFLPAERPWRAVRVCGFSKFTYLQHNDIVLIAF